MRAIAPIFLIAVLVTLALVATVVVMSILDSTSKVEALHIQSKLRPLPDAISDDPGGLSDAELEDIDENEPSSVVQNDNPDEEPVLDMDYDDSWVANIPEVIGGYKVLYIETPKSVACSHQAQIAFLAHQGSLDEFLAAPLDVHSLRAAIRSIEGGPLVRHCYIL